MPYLGGSEGLDSKIQNGQAPDFTVDSLLWSKMLETWEKICLLFKLDFEQKSQNWGKILVLPYLEGSDGLDLEIQKD